MIYISNKILVHGLGSRVLKIIHLIGYVEHLKSIGRDVEFVYTPLSFEGYGVIFTNNELKSYTPFKITNQRDDYLEVCNRWDCMLGFKGLKITDVSDVKFLIHPNIDESTISKETYLNIYKQKDKIKNCLSLPKSGGGLDYIDVGVHIRRADVGPNGSYVNRWLSDEYYLGVIDNIKSTLNTDYKITIYVQRKNFNHKLFSEYDIVYDDGGVSDNEVWLKLLYSDILVMGKSSFSHSAGMLSNGMCIYSDDTKHYPSIIDKEWVSSNDVVGAIKLKYEI